MSCQIIAVPDNPVQMSVDQSQSAVISGPDLLDFFQKTIAPICDPKYYYEDVLEAIHKLDIPFKYQLVTLGVQAYLGESRSLATTEKIVKMLVEKGYLYHASLLASSQKDNSLLLEPICTPIFNKLEKYGKCVEELRNLKFNIQSIDGNIESLVAKGHFNEALALLPFVSDSWTKITGCTDAVKRLSDAGRVDEAMSVFSQMPNWSIGKTEANVHIIKALAKQGDIQGALRFIAQVKEEGYQDKARISIVVALAKAGQVAKASVVFQEIVNAYCKEQAALSILIAMIEASKLDVGQLDRAVELLKSVSNFPSSIVLNRTAQVAEVTSCDVKGDLIQALLSVDRLEEAKAIFVATADEKEQAMLGLPIIERLLDIGRVEEAKVMMVEFSENSLFQDKGKMAIIKHSLREFLVTALEIKALVKESREVFKEAKMQEQREQTNAECRDRACSPEDEINSKIKPLEEALKLLVEISDVNERSLALSSIMKGFLKADLISKGVKVFSMVEDVNYQILYPVLRDLVMTFIDQGNIEEAIDVVDEVSDSQVESMLVLPILKALLEKEELEKAIELLDGLSSNEKCLNGVKLKLAEKMIRKNSYISPLESYILIESFTVHASSYISVIRALKDIGDINKATHYIKMILPLQEDQDPLSEITIEILKDLAIRGRFIAIQEINSLITDETLQEKVIRAFKESVDLDEALKKEVDLAIHHANLKVNEVCLAAQDLSLGKEA